MPHTRWFAIPSALLLSLIAFSVSARSSNSGTDTRQIEAFNQKLHVAILHMDNAAIMDLWADDGVDLMPETAPISGKAAIAKWLDSVTSGLKGYRVTEEKAEFHDIQISGDWASEWAIEHQVVQPPHGKKPIEGHGKMLLVLHRDAAGNWKIQQEMWNSAPQA